MDAVSLPPDLEQFVADAVAAGRYRDLGEVVVAGVSLLRRTEALRESLVASVTAAEARGERDGFLSINDVVQDADAVLQRMAGEKAAGPQR